MSFLYRYKKDVARTQCRIYLPCHKLNVWEQKPSCKTGQQREGKKRSDCFKGRLFTERDIHEQEVLPINSHHQPPREALTIFLFTWDERMGDGERSRNFLLGIFSLGQ